VQQFAVNARGEPLAKPKLEVRGQYLQALSNSEQLRSNLPVQLNYSGGTVQALGFEYDHLRGLLSFTGHTTGRFATSVKK
jgi:lipopolysaccharide export system protein LptC